MMKGYFRKGMIVKWIGNNPCIGQLQKRAKPLYLKDRCWILSDSHNSCSENNLIRATDDEKIKFRTDNPNKEIIML